MKKLFRFAFLFCILILLLVFSANHAVEKAVKNKTFSDVSQLRHHKVGLVLGTAKLLKSGYQNLYFTYRVNATVELYKAGKIDYVLVSGDNSSKEYDEPTDFKEALIAEGIPEDKIYLDYAGFRTLDSMVRAKEIFGLTNFIVISQQFHNERAIYLAERNDMKVVGFNARDVSSRYGLKVQLREYLARTKVFVDLILGVDPKFLGKKITIGE